MEKINEWKGLMNGLESAYGKLWKGLQQDFANKKGFCTKKGYTAIRAKLSCHGFQTSSPSPDGADRLQQTC